MRLLTVHKGMNSMLDQNSQQGSEGETKQSSKGNFTQVPNELIEFFMNRKHVELTSCEYAIIFFLIRELQGWDYKFKPIEIADFSHGTGLDPRKVMRALKELVVERNLIIKKKIKGFRTPCYGFNEDRIGRALVTNKPRCYFKQNSKVVDLATFKVVNMITPEVVESITHKRRKTATRAAEQASKDTYIPINTNLKSGNKVDTFEGNGTDWDPNGPAKAREILKMVKMKSMPQ